MESRQLGRSGFKVPELCFGAGTFGAGDEFFKAWGDTSDADAVRIIDLCMDAGANFFDTADIYSGGKSEQMLGRAIAHLHREDILLSTKATFRLGAGPNDVGSSRYHLASSPSSAASSASIPTTSTSITCTPSTPRRPSRKPSKLSTNWSRTARFATSPRPTSPAGSS